MKNRKFDQWFMKMFLVVLTASLLALGVQSLAMAQQSTPGFTDPSYPSDYYRPANTSGGISTDSAGRIHLEPMAPPVADHAAMGVHMGEGTTSGATASTSDQNAPSRPMVPVAGD
jgi:hypothetical protein